MKYKKGSIVCKKNDGKEVYKIIFVKGSVNAIPVMDGFDYVIKNTNNVTHEHVLEHDIVLL